MGCDCVIHVIKEGLSEEEKLANSQVVSTGAEDKFEAVGFSSCSACGVILWLLGVRRPGLEAGAGSGATGTGMRLGWAPRASTAGTLRDPGCAHGHRAEKLEG